MLKKLKKKLKSVVGKKTKTSTKAKTKARVDKKSPGKKRVSKKHAIKKRGRKVRDPEAKQEAKRYDNPVASRVLILKTIKKAGMMTQASVFKALHVRPDQEEGVGRRLSAMVRDGQLVQNRRGGYLPVDEKHLIKGVIAMLGLFLYFHLS